MPHKLPPGASLAALVVPWCLTSCPLGPHWPHWLSPGASQAAPWCLASCPLVPHKMPGCLTSCPLVPQKLPLMPYKLPPGALQVAPWCLTSGPLVPYKLPPGVSKAAFNASQAAPWCLTSCPRCRGRREKSLLTQGCNGTEPSGLWHMYIV